MVTGIKSSNSQLFKGSESTGAIPLTFNNSIAEVLAAAASKTKINKSREPSPKPEITITAKNSKLGTATGSIEALAKITKKTAGGSLTPSGLSIQKKPIQGTINPLTNMSKLLQSSAPGLPPHIIAQQTMPVRPTGGMVGGGSTTIKPANKLLPRSAPTQSPMLQQPFRPVNLGANKVSSTTGIQTVNKKSLTTVLDRLNSHPASTNISKGNSTVLSSSLVQQLQAPLASQQQSPALLPVLPGTNIYMLSQDKCNLGNYWHLVGF